MSIFDTARFVISAAKLSGLPPEAVPEIAFAGRSNAGKSTTINVLTRKTRLAFASKTPGRTQLINFFALSKKNEEGVRQDVGCLVDLPGYGFAKASEDTRKTWSQLVGGYIAQRPNMVGLVIVMDARRLERESADFFGRVRNAYLDRAARDPKRFVTVNAEEPPETIAAALEKEFAQWL